MKRPLGHLQAKIDADLLGRVSVLAAKRTVQEGRRIYPRDIIVQALEDHVPKAERAFEKASAARSKTS